MTPCCLTMSNAVAQCQAGPLAGMLGCVERFEDARKMLRLDAVPVCHAEADVQVAFALHPAGALPARAPARCFDVWMVGVLPRRGVVARSRTRLISTWSNPGVGPG